MKQLSALLLVFFGFVCHAQIVNIPDANFKAKLLQASSSNQIASSETPVFNTISYAVTSYNSVDTNGDGEIQVSEAHAIKWLKLNGFSIADLTGIEAFANLVYLDCNGNQITDLDISGLNTLKSFNCYDNPLTNLNFNGLTNLELFTTGGSLNELTNLDFTSLTNLKYLYCGQGHLSSINISGLTNLLSLNCISNQITSLNFSGATNLILLNCSYNQIANLDVSNLSNLTHLKCNNNQMTNLIIQGTDLQNLDCFNNLLTSLDASNLSNMIILHAENNHLQNINLSGLTNLLQLHIHQNQLSTLNVDDLVNLKYLFCYSNQFTSLNLSSLVSLIELNCSNNQIQILDLSELSNLNRLNCSNNQLTYLSIKNGFPYWAVLTLNANPNLNFICTDTEDIGLVQNMVNQYGYINCTVSSDCSLNNSSFNFSNDFTFYPNPVKNILTITNKQDQKVESIHIYNVLGQLVLKHTNLYNSIDVSSLQPGNYFIKITTEKGTSSATFVKK